MTSFIIGSRVVLKDLTKAPQYNGKTGVVRSAPNQEGRQHVFVEEFDKLLALKPSNLTYEPRTLESLSVKELKAILKSKNKSIAELSGMDKSDLRGMVSKFCSDSNQIGELLAKGTISATPAAATASSGPFSTEQFKSQADQMAQMSPEQLMQQARMMRTMDPAALRRMNPQMAGLTDEQIKMSANQMEMLANNPSMLKAAVEQMKNMSAQDVEEKRRAMTGGAGKASSSAASNSGRPFVNPASNPNFSSDAANINPEQLRQQAQMMKNLNPDQIRSMMPQLANMTDEQIKEATAQMEMVASNPEMLNMAKEQLKNMSPEEVESIRTGGMPTVATPGTTGATPAAAASVDPSTMLQDMDPEQLKQMLNMVKKNPGMLKELMKSNPAMSNMSEEQLSKNLDMLTNMDEKQLERAVHAVKTVQKYAAPFTTAYGKANGIFGGQLGKLLLFGFAVMVCLAGARLFGFWGSASVDGSSSASGLADMASQPLTANDGMTDEFESEF